MSRRQEQLDAAAALGRAIGEAIPKSLVVRHEVKHLIEYAPRPVPVRVYAEVSNNMGEIWRCAGYTLGPGQRALALNHFPIAWLTGRQEDNATLGQAGIELRFEY